MAAQEDSSGSAPAGDALPQGSVTRERLEVGSTSVPLGHGTVIRGEKPSMDFMQLGPSPLLGRLGAFMPAMKTANQELQGRIASEGADAVNLEVLAPESTGHIEMNLQVGEIPDALVSDDEDGAAPPEGAAGTQASSAAVQAATDEEDKDVSLD